MFKNINTRLHFTMNTERKSILIPSLTHYLDAVLVLDSLVGFAFTRLSLTVW